MSPSLSPAKLLMLVTLTFSTAFPQPRFKISVAALILSVCAASLSFKQSTYAFNDSPV